MLLPFRPAGALLLLLLLLGPALRPAPLDAAVPSGPTLQATAGFGGYGRIGGWLPLSVTADNSGPDLNAELVAFQRAPAAAVPPQAPAASYTTRYSVAADLPHGAHKRFTLHVPLPALSNEVDVQLRAGTTVLASARTAVTIIGPDQVLVGLVSDASTSLPALAQQRLPAISAAPVTVRVASLAPAALPVDPLELTGFDVLVAARASTDRFTPAQVTALEGWVARGGLLVLNGGSDWAALSAGLPRDLLPVQHPVLGTLPDLAALGAFAGSAWIGGKPVAVTLGQVRGRVLVRQAGVPLLALLPYGNGNVAFSAADLTVGPLAVWLGGTGLWQHLLLLGLPAERLATSPVAGPTSYDPYVNLTGALSNIPPPTRPAWPFLGGILALYLLATPGSWLLLRHLGRPGLTWVALPALALGFAVWTYGAAFRERGSVAIVNSITLSEYPANAAVGRVTTFLGLFAPNDQTYHLRFAKPSLLTSMATPLFKRFLGGPGPQTAPGLAVRDDGLQLDLLPMPQWTARAVRTARWVAGPSGIDAHVETDAGAVWGTVTNRTGHPLIDCAISTPWGAQPLGTLAANSSASFRLSRLSGGTSTLPQLYGQAPNQAALSPLEQRHQQLEQQVINLLWSYAGPTGSGTNAAQLGPMLFVGWGDARPIDLTVDERRVPQAGAGLLIAGLPFPSLPSSTVPAGLLTAPLVAGSSGAQLKGNTIDLTNASVTVAAPLPGAALPSSVTLRLTAPVYSRGLSTGVTMAALNRATGRYVPLPLTALSAPVPTPGLPSGKVIAVARAGGVLPPVSRELDATLGPGDLRPYMGSGGSIRFRLIATMPNVIIFYPITYGYTYGATVAGGPPGA